MHLTLIWVNYTIDTVYNNNMLIIIDGCCLDAPRNTCKILIIELKQSEDLITKVFVFFNYVQKNMYTVFQKNTTLLFLKKTGIYYMYTNDKLNGMHTEISPKMF